MDSRQLLIADIVKTSPLSHSHSLSLSHIKLLTSQEQNVVLLNYTLLVWKGKHCLAWGFKLNSVSSKSKLVLEKAEEGEIRLQLW